MGKSVGVLFFISFLCLSLHAQKLEKIKGNRTIVIQETLINSFHTLDVNQDLEIELKYGAQASVEIETDENLHAVIQFDVRDSLLSFTKTHKITSKKRLKIKVTYDTNLNTIRTRDKAEIKSLNTLELPCANVKASGSSKMDLTIKTDSFKFEGHDRSKTKLDLRSHHSEFILNDSSRLNGLITSTALKAMLYQRAYAEINGTGHSLWLRTNNSAQFMGKNYSIETGDVNCENTSEATIDATNNISIEASGSSSVYLYNNPKITINSLTDTAKLQKKLK
ncbi:GIN domain-containing protein [Mariniflexile ostreae]|uniref:GIN domain-containing protein n=1 Tax=Mariniflexile ostreae TaxID=1520892 RepID=A0ABV5FA96_9FLAO